MPHDCYCDERERHPEAFERVDRPGVLERRALPPGYCGWCIVCGGPGHARHFPGAVPFTGAWCDRHDRRLRLTHPASPIGCLVWLTAVGVVVVLARMLLR
jgi:hypothetical protein